MAWRNVAFRERPLLLSAMPPTLRQRRLALSIAIMLFVGFVATFPFSDHLLPRQDAFIPVVDTMLFLADLTTAALLFTQYAVSRSRGLLALATGYLVTSFIIVPHALTFPGAFSQDGLLGASLQTSVWLNVFWHIGLPTGAIIYATTKNRKDGLDDGRSPSSAIRASIIAAALCALGLAWLTTAGASVLPVIMIDSLHASGLWRVAGAPPLLALSVTSIVLVWRRRSSVLDLWLLVVLWAWLIETALLSTTAHRFSVVWYAGRAFGLLASSFVLLVLISESTKLYARLALSVAAQDREREGRRMTLDVVVGSLAHELRQPLCAILANGNAGVRLLGHAPPDLNEVRASLHDIVSDARRADQVIQAVRTIFAGSTTSDPSWLDVNALLRDALVLLQFDLKSHDVTVVTSGDHLPRVRGERVQLLQVFLNVITNAIESMASVSGRQRVLAIRLAQAETDRVSIEMEDSGIGIHPDDVRRIFEPFFTTKSNGTGLGLAICRAIVDAHGGQLSAAPGADYGSIVRIALPLTPPRRRITDKPDAVPERLSPSAQE